jgi:putative redox protein
MSMTATAAPFEGGFRTIIEVNGRHTLVADEPERLGGTDEGPAPHELLPAMLAACVSVTITAYANQRGIDLRGMRIDVLYDNESSPRRVQTVVHAPDGLSAEQLSRLQRVADSCPVKRALEAGFDFETCIVADATADSEVGAC